MNHPRLIASMVAGLLLTTAHVAAQEEAPTLTDVDVVGKRVIFHWQAVEGARRYRIQFF